MGDDVVPDLGRFGSEFVDGGETADEEDDSDEEGDVCESSWSEDQWLE